MIALAVLLQAATAAPSVPVTRVSAAPPARFSILSTPCPRPGGSDVVVCGDKNSALRLPLPDDAPPSPNYVKPDSGDYRDNRGGAAPCAARMEGCQVGFGPPLMKWIAAGARALGDAAKTRREAKARVADGARRQPIDLGVGPAGRSEP